MIDKFSLNKKKKNISEDDVVYIAKLDYSLAVLVVLTEVRNLIIIL